MEIQLVGGAKDDLRGVNLAVMSDELFSMYLDQVGMATAMMRATLEHVGVTRVSLHSSSKRSTNYTHSSEYAMYERVYTSLASYHSFCAKPDEGQRDVAWNFADMRVFSAASISDTCQLPTQGVNVRDSFVNQRIVGDQYWATLRTLRVKLPQVELVQSAARSRVTANATATSM